MKKEFVTLLLYALLTTFFALLFSYWLGIGDFSTLQNVALRAGILFIVLLLVGRVFKIGKPKKAGNSGKEKQPE